MKVVVASEDNIPSLYAHSISVLKMAQGFLDNGCEVHLLTANGLKSIYNRCKIGDLQKHYSVDLFPVKWLRPTFKGFITGRLAGDYVFAENVAKYAKINSASFVYCRSYRTPVVCVERGLNTVVETHSTNYDYPDIRELQKKAILNNFKALITIHENIAKEHSARGVPEEKIMVMEDGVDLKGYVQRGDSNYYKNELGLNCYNKYVVYAGHLYADKGIEIIMEVAKCTRRFTDIKYLLVGGFDRDVKLWMRYCKKRNIDNVIFVGFVPNKNIPNYLMAADVLILPYDMKRTYSVMDINTTSPLKLFEYMAAGRPIVAADIPTIRKVLKNNNNAYLCDTNDPVSSFYDGVMKVISDQCYAQHISENVNVIAREYTWLSRCKRIIEKI